MKVSIQHQPRELLVQTVSLIKNFDDPNNVYLFRCPYCANSTEVQVQGMIANITPGVIPTDDVITVHQCKKCKNLYTFQTISHNSKKMTTMTIVSRPNSIGVIHCWLCRNPLLQFTGDKIVKLPQFDIVRIPFQMNCINSACPIKYKIMDII